MLRSPVANPTYQNHLPTTGRYRRTSADTAQWFGHQTGDRKLSLALTLYWCSHRFFWFITQARLPFIKTGNGITALPRSILPAKGVQVRIYTLHTSRSNFGCAVLPQTRHPVAPLFIVNSAVKTKFKAFALINFPLLYL